MFDVSFLFDISFLYIYIFISCVKWICIVAFYQNMLKDDELRFSELWCNSWDSEPSLSTRTQNLFQQTSGMLPHFFSVTFTDEPKVLQRPPCFLFWTMVLWKPAVQQPLWLLNFVSISERACEATPLSVCQEVWCYLVLVWLESVFYDTT